MRLSLKRTFLLFGFTLIVLFLLFPKNVLAQEECSLYLKWPAIPEFCRGDSGCPDSIGPYCATKDISYYTDFKCKLGFCFECVTTEECANGCDYLGYYEIGTCLLPEKPCDKITSQSECESAINVGRCRYCDISNGCMDQSSYAEACKPQCDDGIDNDGNGCWDYNYHGDTGCYGPDDPTEAGGCCPEAYCKPEIIRDGNCCVTYCIANDGSTTKPGKCGGEGFCDLCRVDGDGDGFGDWVYESDSCTSLFPECADKNETEKCKMDWSNRICYDDTDPGKYKNDCDSKTKYTCSGDKCVGSPWSCNEDEVCTDDLGGDYCQGVEGPVICEKSKEGEDCSSRNDCCSTAPDCYSTISGQKTCHSTCAAKGDFASSSADCID